MSGFGASGAGAKMQMRPGGGFRQSFGSFSDEHENENAAAAAAAQKQATQQSSVLGQTGVTKQQAAAAPTGQPAQTDSSSAVSSEFGKYQAQPRNVSSLKEELLTRPGKDILTTFKSFFDINLLLNINQADSPEKKAKKQKIAHNWQRLTAEEQAYVRQQLQEQQQKKQQELQAEEQKKRRASPTSKRNQSCSSK